MRNRKQAGRLPEDQIEMLVQRNQLAEFLHLQEFALDHLLGEFDQRVEHAEVAFLHRDLERLHVQPVAREHALRISPAGIGCRTPASSLSLVNNVVVYQRGRVNDLDHRTQPYCSKSLVVEELRRQQQKRGPDPFPPPSRRYSPISVMAETSETVSRPNSASIASRSSCRSSKISFPLMAVGVLNSSLNLFHHGVTEKTHLAQPASGNAHGCFAPTATPDLKVFLRVSVPLW